MLFIQDGSSTCASGSAPAAFVHSTTTLGRLRRSSSSRAGWGAAAAVAVLVIAALMVAAPQLSGGTSSSNELRGSNDESSQSSGPKPCFFFSLDTEGEMEDRYGRLKGARDIAIKAFTTWPDERGPATYRSAITEGVKSHFAPTEGTPKPWRDVFNSVCDFLEAETPKDMTPCFLAWSIDCDLAKIAKMNGHFSGGKRPACAAAFSKSPTTTFDAFRIAEDCRLRKILTNYRITRGGRAALPEPKKLLSQVS